MAETNVNAELETVSWIAGSFQELEFQVKSPDVTEPVDLVIFSEIRWVLFRYGDPDNPILNLRGHVVASDTSKFNVYVLSEYTSELDGLFVQQPVLIDGEGKEFRPAQGQIHISAQGKKDNSITIEPGEEGINQ